MKYIIFLMLLFLNSCASTEVTLDNPNGGLAPTVDQQETTNSKSLNQKVCSREELEKVLHALERVTGKPGTIEYMWEISGCKDAGFKL